MLVAVHAVGRMKAGAERDLAARYLDRFANSGPTVGLEFSGVFEVAEGRAQSAEERRHDEADRLRAQFAKGAALIALDERGKNLASTDLAKKIGDMRDGGRRNLAVVIGGPDGLDPRFRAESDLALSFGLLTWPHQLVRVMLAEQLYRIATILAGHPYHRT
jgi:23S rRNA (pseudouridine1915-N3)-methyltransferase